MKRFISILLAVMLLLAMTACGKGEAESSSGGGNGSAADTVEVSQTGTGEPSQAETREEWVLVSEEQTIPHNLLTENEIENMAGRPYRVIGYSYDERGNVVTELTEYFCYDTPDFKKREYLREYDDHDKLTHFKRTYSGTGATVTVTDEYYQNEYQGGNLIRRVTTKDSAPDEIVEYEYDGAGRVIRESVKESGSDVKTYRISEYENDLLMKYIREVAKDDGSASKVEYEKINEYDAEKNLVKITETQTYISRSETTVSTREFDDNGHIIKNVSVTTGPSDVYESELYEVWTRRYDEDGHSYLQTYYHVTDPSEELTSDIIVEEVYYKYLPLSEALKQQAVAQEQDNTPDNDAIIFTGPSESTLTHLEQDGYMSKWDFIVPRRYHETLTFGVKSGRGTVRSESGNFNGTVEYGDTTITIHFDLNDKLYQEFGTYDFVFIKE